MQQVIVDKVLSIINRNLKGVELIPNNINDNLSDFGVDSIAFIQIIIMLEDEFECEIPDSKLLFSEMDTVKKIADVLQNLYVGSYNLNK